MMSTETLMSMIFQIIHTPNVHWYVFIFFICSTTPTYKTICKTPSVITEEDIRQFQDLQSHTRETIHGDLAVEIARINHILPEHITSWNTTPETEISIANANDLKNLQIWEKALEKNLQKEADFTQIDIDISDHSNDEGHVYPLEQMLASDRPPVSQTDEHDEILRASLNEEQQRAYDIIDYHLQQTLHGKQPPQLRMIIPGEGATGKSHTIQTITNGFIQHNVKHWLVKGAYTGIAASIIDGSTLHVLTAMPIRGSRSAKTMKKLKDFWTGKKYLIIDEMSMLSREFLAKISKILTIVLGTEDDNSKDMSFGGLNVILAGDFHQFPPVVSRRSAPLFYPNNSRFDNTEELIGREIYEQFNIVVRLTKQVRVEDPIWLDILQHV
jgi:hypothetical protein